MTQPATKASLYKFLTPSTAYGSLESEVYSDAVEWLLRRAATTTRRTVFDGLLDSFLWFAVTRDGSIYLPAPHVARLRRQLEARIGPRAAGSEANHSLLRRLVWRGDFVNGQQIRAQLLQDVVGDSRG